MRVVNFAPVLVLCMAQILGCASHNEGRDKTKGISWQEVQQRQYEGSISVDNVQVYYEKGYSSQAECILNTFVSAICHIHDVTGFRPTINKIKFYILKGDRDPLQYEQRMFGVRGANGGCEVSLILFVKSVDESCESAISQSDLYPYIFVHEIVEVSLVMGKGSKPIIMDYGWQSFWPMQRKGTKYTRWFREGFANYAGYLAHKHIWSEMSPKEHNVFYSEIECGVHNRPFSALREVGKNLFTWPQYSNGKFNSSVLHYEASFGLFLLIRHLYGEEVLKSIILDIATLKKADGPALIKLVNTKINADVEKLAEDFRFPKTGMETGTSFPDLPEELRKDFKDGAYVLNVEPDSPAERAGIRKGDLICGLNGKEIKTGLDFELSLFDLANCQTVEIVIVRDGSKNIIANLQLIK
jgi:hypothetical protein